MSLYGTHFVRALRSALQAAKHFWPKVGDRMDVRRHALKLRFWGERHEKDDQAAGMDLSCERIKAMAGSGVYELRIDDEIGGRRNIRIIFLVPPDAWKANWDKPKPVIWVLDVLPKKRQDWTNKEIDRFWAK